MENKIGLQVRRCTKKDAESINKGGHVKGSIELDMQIRQDRETEGVFQVAGKFLNRLKCVSLFLITEMQYLRLNKFQKKLRVLEIQ